MSAWPAWRRSPRPVREHPAEVHRRLPAPGPRHASSSDAAANTTASTPPTSSGTRRSHRPRVASTTESRHDRPVVGEAGAHPERLGHAHVLHQPEQRGVGIDEPPARVVVGDAFDLPHQRLTGVLQQRVERGDSSAWSLGGRRSLTRDPPRCGKTPPATRRASARSGARRVGRRSAAAPTPRPRTPRPRAPVHGR